jgi:hypothetical protein
MMKAPQRPRHGRFGRHCSRYHNYISQLIRYPQRLCRPRHAVAAVLANRSRE